MENINDLIAHVQALNRQLEFWKERAVFLQNEKNACMNAFEILLTAVRRSVDQNSRWQEKENRLRLLVQSYEMDSTEADGRHSERQGSRV
jgi:hypothetical protein